MYKLNITMDEFMNNTLAYGGNWTAMLLSGVKAVYPELYEAMPDITYSFYEVSTLVNLLCEDCKTNFKQAYDAVCLEDDEATAESWHRYLNVASELADERDAIFQALLWRWRALCVDKLLDLEKNDKEKVYAEIARLDAYSQKFAAYAYRV